MKLENVEEKFYFKTSHFFWHFVTGLGALILVVSVFLLLWGFTPSFKPGVKKPDYPKAVQVTAEEVLQKIQPPTPKKESASPAETVTIQSTPQEIITETENTKSIEEKSYSASLDSLKKLLPPEKFQWETKGYWENNWYRREWVVTSYGIQNRLDNIFNKLDADNYNLKKNLLDSYISLLALFNEDQRLAVLRSAMDFCKNDVTTSIANIDLLKYSVPNFTTDNSDFISKLATFGAKNPRDGRSFIEYMNNVMPKFSSDIRPSLLSAFIYSYYNYFNDIEKQKEATDLFLSISDKLSSVDQVKALNEYYLLFIQKNYSRENEIESINRNYQAELSNAQSILAKKQSKKAEYRLLAIKGIGGSIVFIAFVALFLVMFSIQRNVKLLRIEKTNNQAI